MVTCKKSLGVHDGVTQPSVGCQGSQKILHLRRKKQELAGWTWGRKKITLREERSCSQVRSVQWLKDGGDQLCGGERPGIMLEGGVQDGPDQDIRLLLGLQGTSEGLEARRND